MTERTSKQQTVNDERDDAECVACSVVGAGGDLVDALVEIRTGLSSGWFVITKRRLGPRLRTYATARGCLNREHDVDRRAALDLATKETVDVESV